VSGSDAVTRAVRTHRDFVSAETLAVSLTFGEASGRTGSLTGDVGDGEAVTVAVARTV
jgi:hypothetical protein